MKILKQGSRGYEVKIVQDFLKEENFFFGAVDGIFGPATRNSVILFQNKYGLVADGIVGNASYSKMREIGFGVDGTELESLNINEEEIRKIIDVNSYKLIASKNYYNDSPSEFDPEKHIVVVAIRGFKLNSMGKFGENDRRIYDDAHFIVTPRQVKAFEGNTDPNGYRKGSGTGSNKGMACLKEGVWFYAKGLHRGSPAFRQACPFTVERDGSPNYEHTGYLAINWHSAGNTSKSSLGCQTNRPTDFANLRYFMYKQLDEFNNPMMRNDWGELERSFPYILIDEKKRRSGDLRV